MDTVLIIALVIVGGGAVFFWLFSRRGAKKVKPSLYTDALNAIIRGDRTTAYKDLRETVRSNSGHIDAYLHLGNLYRDDNPSQAVKIHQSLTVRPNLQKFVQVLIHQELARDYQALGNAEKAKREAEAVLRLEKRNLWATQFLIDLAIDSKDWPEAGKLTKLHQRLTNQTDVRTLAEFEFRYGKDLLEQKKYDDARSAFQSAIKTDKTYALPHFYIGLSFEREDNLVKAVEHWEKFALADLSAGVSCYQKIESALFDLGRFSEIERFYRHILEQDSGNLEALVNLANVLEEKGDRKEALQLVDDALNRNSGDLHARLMKIKLKVKNGSPSELARELDKIIEDLPKQELPE